MEFLEQLDQARIFGVPLIAIQSADQLAIVPVAVKTLCNGAHSKRPCVTWDICAGFKDAGNGKAAVLALLADNDPSAYSNPFDALRAGDRLPRATRDDAAVGGVLMILLADRYLVEPAIVQAILNLRDEYKTTGRVLVLLGTNFRLPPELQSSVLLLDEPLPNETRIGEVIDAIANDNEIKLGKSERAEALAALRGLPEFSAEQAFALSCVREEDKFKVSKSALWDRKRQTISQVAGLSAPKVTVTLEDMGGLASIKDYMKQYFAGPCRPRVLVFMDEIEKALGGAGANGATGDSSGTSQDALGVVLNQMETNEWTGIIALGPPGTGKSYVAHALAGSMETPLIVLDLGAAKGSLVGESERKIREAMKAILAIAGKGGAFFIATCNRLDTLPPELQRRFSSGLWFFDLPDAEERVAIAKLQAARYGVKFEPEFWAALEGFSGANIRDTCKTAYALCTTPQEAMVRIVPAAKQAPTQLVALRGLAVDRFLSASYDGTYVHPENREEATEKPQVKRRFVS